METFNIFIIDQPEFEDKFRIRGTFLHGKIEKDLGHDLYSFDKPTNFGEGIHTFKFNEKDCILFLWQSDILDKLSGLLIYADDLVSYEDALKKYKEKSDFI